MIETDHPLAGLTVLDLGIITAGAATSQVFADFGADVIKIESVTYTDPFRKWSQVAGAADGTGAPTSSTSSPPFESVNRGKHGVALDLKTPIGRQVFLDLVRDADIVVENFRRGVLERLGIDFDALRAVNPRIILLSLSSQGTTGPESTYISFGSPLEALGGTMAITGYGPDEPPLWTGNNVNYPDQLVSYLAPGLALAALRAREATGEAIHIDAAQREAVTSVVGETIVEHSATGASPRPIGNRHPHFAPQGIYRTDGDDEWVAISVQSDAQWRALVSLPELFDLGDDRGLDESAGRRAAHDHLDEVLAAFCRASNRHVLAERLQELGVPASAVLRPSEVLHDPQLEALGFHTVVDSEPIVQRGFLAHLLPQGGEIARRAPGLGEHTTEILRSRLNYDLNQIHDLHRSGAIYCAELTSESGLTTVRTPASATR